MKNEVPPEIATYLKGPAPECGQFDFLIGEWDVLGTRYREDGTELPQFRANWHARHLDGGRMVMDDFKTLAPDGREISYMVTLRTYCEATRRWELTGLAAHQPAWNAQWSGQWEEGEMRLEARGYTPAGTSIRNRIRFFDIEQNAFRWESEISLDDGKTWTRSVALTATRAYR